MEAPSECEKINELCEAEEAEAGAKASQATKGCDEVLDGVDHVLVVLDNGLVLEVHVQKGQVLLINKLVLLIRSELPHDPAGLAGETRHAVCRDVLCVGTGWWTEASGVLYKVFTLFMNMHAMPTTSTTSMKSKATESPIH